MIRLGFTDARWVAALAVLLILAPMAAIVLVGIGATLSRTGLDAFDLLLWKLLVCAIAALLTFLLGRFVIRHRISRNLTRDALTASILAASLTSALADGGLGVKVMAAMLALPPGLPLALGLLPRKA